MEQSRSVELVIEPRTRDLGGFEVRRVLPHAQRRLVGPFIFFDHMGPVSFTPGRGVDVRPHPHVCLATVTYLFDGDLVHRDSLGSVQVIRPGDVNWMTAGRGIVHSERTSPETRARGARLHGIQSWVALPRASEETEPGFSHHPVAELPHVARDGVRLRLIAGRAFGAASPVATFSDMHYADASFEPGGHLVLDATLRDRAIYVVEGAIRVGDEASFPAGRMIVLGAGGDVTIRSDRGARAMLLGGTPLDGERHIWWNFVASTRERIDRAARQWDEGGFPGVPGDDERIPLPPA
jgi:redox-sensitive bicupin YhaK (pirin superfamily)